MLLQLCRKKLSDLHNLCDDEKISNFIAARMNLSNFFADKL
jgi:hypothetical protein